MASPVHAMKDKNFAVIFTFLTELHACRIKVDRVFARQTFFFLFLATFLFF